MAASFLSWRWMYIKRPSTVCDLKRSKENGALAVAGQAERVEAQSSSSFAETDSSRPPLLLPPSEKHRRLPSYSGALGISSLLPQSPLLIAPASSPAPDLPVFPLPPPVSSPLSSAADPHPLSAACGRFSIA
ncbi:hypothetical protein BHM03_00046404 [Ensete ventricosum]|nr:hypothetical protein BHM03_00046404 [Ensete ventricosum]